MPSILMVKAAGKGVWIPAVDGAQKSGRWSGRGAAGGAHRRVSGGPRGEQGSLRATSFLSFFSFFFSSFGGWMGVSVVTEAGKETGNHGVGASAGSVLVCHRGG